MSSFKFAHTANPFTEELCVSICIKRADMKFCFRTLDFNEPKWALTIGIYDLPIWRAPRIGEVPHTTNLHLKTCTGVFWLCMYLWYLSTATGSYLMPWAVCLEWMVFGFISVANLLWFLRLRNGMKLQCSKSIFAFIFPFLWVGLIPGFLLNCIESLLINTEKYLNSAQLLGTMGCPKFFKGKGGYIRSWQLSVFMGQTKYQHLHWNLTWCEWPENWHKNLRQSFRILFL